MPASGDLLAGRYRILAPLGAGGVATVYRAHDERLGREVAIKILLPNLAGDPVVAARFEREARTLAAAAHPGVVSIFDVDAGDPSRGREPFFVMELCPGGSLSDRLTDGKRLSPDELIPTLVSIADGLADLHARGVIHRDVKPSNILFATNRAKLADFGLARDDTAESDELTTPGTAAGTMAYLAPEVLAGKTATTAADVYALGVAAFVGLTGTLPRTATSLAALIAASRQEPATVSAMAPDIGQAFDEPIAAALAADPAGRPDALDLASSLTAALGAWGRSRPIAAAAAATLSSRSAADLGDDATTAVAVPIDDTTSVEVPVMTPRAVEPTRVSEDGSSRRWRGPAAVAVAALLGAIALWGVLGHTSGSGPVIAPVSSPTPRPVVTPTPTSIPSASPSITATPAEPAAPAAGDSALAALDEVDAAINDTAGKDGLKGKERNELVRVAAEVRSALADGNRDAAGAAAEALADRIEDVHDELDERRAQRLEDAVSNLIDVLGAE